MSNGLPDPQPGEFWTTSKGRTVEILARDVVEHHGDWTDAEIDTVAYEFLGGKMIHRELAQVGAPRAGLEFLDPYGSDTGDLWRAFRTDLAPAAAIGF